MWKPHIWVRDPTCTRGSETEKEHGYWQKSLQPKTLFYKKEYIWAKMRTIAGKQNLNGLKKCSWRMIVFHLILCLRLNGGYTESIGGRLGRREKTRRGNLWDWIKSKVERHRLPLQRWAQHTETVCGKQITMLHLVLWCLGLCLEQDCPPGPTFS